MGGVREQRTVLNNLQADAFRSGAQSQLIAQAAEATILAVTLGSPRIRRGGGATLQTVQTA